MGDAVRAVFLGAVLGMPVTILTADAIPASSDPGTQIAIMGIVGAVLAALLAYARLSLTRSASKEDAAVGAERDANAARIADLSRTIAYLQEQLAARDTELREAHKVETDRVIPALHSAADGFKAVIAFLDKQRDAPPRQRARDQG